MVFMTKEIRNAVRSFLIKENKVIAINYKTGENNGYYDIPGGKIELGESSYDASVREFSEETGMHITNQQYKGHIILDYPDKIFNLDIYEIIDYKGTPLSLVENEAMWLDIDKLLKQEKKFATVEILKYINTKNLNLKIDVDKKHNIIKIEKLET